MADKHLSKTISYWLRHAPEEAGLTPDVNGWVPTHELLKALKEKAKRNLSQSELEALTTTFDKQRWEFSEDGSRIRATHGHSISVEPIPVIATPPPVLYHGTYSRAVEAILLEGLKPMSRQYVHLSETIEQASSVASRHGKPVIFSISTAALIAEGLTVIKTASGVWLVQRVPASLLCRIA